LGLNLAKTFILAVKLPEKFGIKVINEVVLYVLGIITHHLHHGQGQEMGHIWQ
jgi:hypothetical protein